MKVINCDPRGTYDANTCPVCGDYVDSVVGDWYDGDISSNDYVCDCCGTEYSVTWRISTITIEKEGVAE